MALRTDYPYEEALDDLRDFFKRRVKNASDKNELLGYLEECRKDKIVTMRYIYERYIQYTEKYKDYTAMPDADKEMIDNLFHFWG